MKKVGGVFLPIEDGREYKMFRLDSGLQVLLVSDKMTDKSSAALSVGVGSFADPEDTEGLAHFCEHMLFFGTEKYPEENGYNTFVNANGGDVNAYTLSESTTYIFDVMCDGLDGALDRFAQFFISPLLTETTTSLELEAIESEHSKNKQSDSWRIYRMVEYTGSSEHPISKFSTGNTETLMRHKDIHQRLIKFYTENYSAQIMKLVVLGRDSIDVLEASVRSKFSSVRSVQVKPLISNGMPFKPEQMCKIVKFLPVKETRSLILAFPMPPIQEHFRTKPVQYLSHLIGHESSGSIFAYLKSQGWANELFSGVTHSYVDCSIFMVIVELTESGLLNIKTVLDVFFTFVSLIRTSGISRDLFDELSRLKMLESRFKEKQMPFKYVAHLADCMRIYPEEYVVIGDYVMDIFDPQLIESFLRRITPENMRIFLCAPEVGTTHQYMEEYFGISYSIEDIDPKQLEDFNRLLNHSWIEENGSHSAFSGKLFIPRLNPFIPENMELVEREPGSPDDPPKLVFDDCKIRFWFKQDLKFAVPKSAFILDIYSTYSYVTPEASIKMRFMVEMLNFALNELFYDASVAGLDYSLTPTFYGLRLIVFGYNCKLSKLVDEIMKNLFGDFFSAQSFELVQERLKREYKNHEFQKPYQIAIYDYKQAMESVRWSVKQYLHILPLITIDQVREWRDICFQHVFIEGLYYGNEMESRLVEIVQALLDRFSGPAILENQFPMLRMVKLTRCEEYWIQRHHCNPQEKNHAIINYYQIDRTNRSLAMSIEFIVQVLKTEVFNVLRSNEQLGYLVFMWNTCDFSVEGVFVCIQSPFYDPVYLDQRIECFLENALKDQLESIPDDVWETHRSSLISKKLKPITNIKKQALQYWKAIDYPKQYNFDQDREDASILKDITREHVIQVYKKYLLPNAKKRAKLSIQTWMTDTQIKGPQKDNVIVLQDVYQLRKFLPLHGVMPFGKPIVTQC